MTRVYKDDKEGNPVDVTDLVIGVPRGEGLSEVTGRIVNREPEMQRLGNNNTSPTAPQVVYLDEADELPSDDLLEAMVRGMDHFRDRPIVGMEYKTIEERTLEHWGPDESIYKTEYGYTGGGMRWKAKAGSKAKAKAKRRAANKAARKARAKAR